MIIKILALGGAVIGGIMLADILTHPKGTAAAGNTLISLEKNTGNQLLGK